MLQISSNDSNPSRLCSNLQQGPTQIHCQMLTLSLRYTRGHWLYPSAFCCDNELCIEGVDDSLRLCEVKTFFTNRVRFVVEITQQVAKSAGDWWADPTQMGCFVSCKPTFVSPPLRHRPPNHHTQPDRITPSFGSPPVPTQNEPLFPSRKPGFCMLPM